MDKFKTRIYLFRDECVTIISAEPSNGYHKKNSSYAEWEAVDHISSVSAIYKLLLLTISNQSGDRCQGLSHHIYQLRFVIMIILYTFLTCSSWKLWFWSMHIASSNTDNTRDIVNKMGSRHLLYHRLDIDGLAQDGGTSCALALSYHSLAVRHNCICDLLTCMFIFLFGFD